MKYKGYEAIIEYDELDKLFVGRVINTLDVIAFDGLSVEELEKSFHSAIDEYLEDCRTQGKAPEKPFSGRFNLRISPDLHRQAVLLAEKEGISLNALVEKSLHHILTKRASSSLS